MLANIALPEGQGKRSDHGVVPQELNWPTLIQKPEK
jgi:hypothetical protein